MKAVIFDMDGVIIDSEPIHYRVNQRIYNSLNITVTREEYSKFIGGTPFDKWLYLKKKHDLEQAVSELVEMQKKGIMKYLQKNQEEPILGLNDLLKKLYKTDLKMALASSSPLEYINLVLKKFKIQKYFSVVTSGDNVENGKPQPDIYLKTARLLKLEPEDCLVIEDSENGVLAAKRAGMTCIGFINENSGNQDLSEADRTVTSLNEIEVDNFITQ